MVHSFPAWLSLLSVDRVFLARRNTVPTPFKIMFNVRVLSKFVYIAEERYHNLYGTPSCIVIL